MKSMKLYERLQLITKCMIRNQSTDNDEFLERAEMPGYGDSPDSVNAMSETGENGQYRRNGKPGGGIPVRP